MTDPNVAPPTPGPNDRIALSMPFSQCAVFQSASPAPIASTPALDERLKVLGLLSFKMRDLKRALYKLEILPRQGLTHAELGQIGDLTIDGYAEYGCCKARYDQIDYGAPFKPLPAGAEAGLLAAMTAVNAHTGGAAALSGLLAAIHGLVVAYGGKNA